jgi:serine/threonine protein kinase/WD40 repeat protein
MTDETVFAAALAIPRPADRAAYLEKACVGNPALRRDVEALLSAHAADNPLDRPPADLAPTGDHHATDAHAGPPAAEVGDWIGPYRLMELIGEGGFGLVFVAEQSEPVRRKVALKVLKPGMDTRDLVARFEAERQALALMDHPNIARVLDVGSTPSGRPYFVMELVRGVPITDYCDAHKLGPKDRLALFVPVCQAVQHAHQKGVIHRDIKPSNVLVTMIDGKPVPKVIDFGVAKAVGQSLTDKTIYTRFAQILGTPLYMSPEQAEMSGVDVDTRADVYALGVLLYELLTGTTPFDRDRFRRAAFDEIRRIIREEEPPRPSTRLSSLGPTLAGVSAQRGTEPGKLAGVVRGELDWIVMKCLEKDRNRRYETASGLARDVERFIRGDAVEACPPTLGYRLRKFYRRNRAAVWIVGLFLGLTYAGASGIYFAYQRAVRAERRLGEERDTALASEERAIAATREAARERDKLAEANASLRALADRQRRTLYVGSMNLAQAAWESGDARRTLELLRQWVPKPGAEDLRGFEWHYWNRQAHQEARSVRLQGLTPQDRATGLVGAVSRDGTRVAGAVDDLARYTSTIRVWDAKSGQELWRASPFPGTLESCSFSDNGQRLLTSHFVRGDGTYRAEARVWDVKDGTLVHTSTPLVNTRPIFIHAFLSADGERLVTDVREGQGNTTTLNAIRVVRVSDGKELARMSVAHRSEPTRVLFLAGSPDLAKVLLCDDSRGPLRYQLRLHDVESGQERWAVDLGDGELPREAWFVPGGDRLLVQVVRVPERKWKAGVIVLDTRGGRRLSTRWLPETPMLHRIGAQTIMLSGSRLAAMLNRRAVVYELDRPADDEQDTSTSFVHESNIAGISLAADGSRLITLDQVGVVREWDLTARPRVVHSFGQSRINADGSRRLDIHLTSGGNTWWAPRIVDASKRELGDRLAPLPPGRAHGPAASADGRTMAIVWHPDQGECLAVAWDLATGRGRCRVTLGPGIWEAIAVSPDGARAALLGGPPEMAGKPHTAQRARIMDLNTGKVVWSSETQGTSRFFHGVEFDPSGRHLVVSQGSSTTSDDWAIVWYDATTLAPAARFPVGSQDVTVAAFSRDGRFVAVREQPNLLYAGGTATVRVFPVAPILRGESPAPRFQLTGSSGQFGHVAFSPDGSRLMASGDRMVRLWETAIGTEVLTLPLKAEVNARNWCSFSSDGHKIWAGLDEKGELWGLDATPLENEAAAP